jgi:uncharacterized protein YlaN (UPF0358 family)
MIDIERLIACCPDREEILCSILIKFGVAIKQVRLIKIGSFDNFPLQNCPKHGNTLLPQLFHLSLEYAIRNIHENQVE